MSKVVSYIVDNEPPPPMSETVWRWYYPTILANTVLDQLNLQTQLESLVKVSPYVVAPKLGRRADL